MVCTSCCATLDNIVTHLFKQLTQKGNLNSFLNFLISNVFCFTQLMMFLVSGKKPRRGVQPSSDMFLQVLDCHPEILQQILSTVLNTIMFEDCRNQWSMSRPLLGLILLNEEVCK